MAARHRDARRASAADVGAAFSPSLHPTDAMNEFDPLVQAAEADFARAGAPAELENAKARYLGKAGRVTELLKALAALAPEEKKRARRRDQCRQAARSRRPWRRAARRSPQAELTRSSQAEALDVTLARPHAAAAAACIRSRAHDGAHRGDLRLDGLRRRRRPRDRDRLVQLHRAQQPREPSGALDAGHLLRRRERRAKAAG